MKKKKKKGEHFLKERKENIHSALKFPGFKLQENEDSFIRASARITCCGFDTLVISFETETLQLRLQFIILL